MRASAMTQPPWMRFAWAELGQRELAGDRSNPRIADYIRRAGHAALADDATAWCAAFVGACLDRAGVPGTGSLAARSYLDWGEPADMPEPGVIAVLSRGANVAHGHVGFLVGMSADKVILLGGNQSDAVSVEAYAAARVLGFRQPASSPVARPGPRSRPAAGAATFDQSLARILAFEGGYSDDPFDPGGPTNRGLTLADYARAVGETVTADNHARLKAELRAIPDALVRDIYLGRYWQPARCPDLPAPLAHFHFDAAVNQGVGAAARMLQEALDVDIDGEIGSLTLAAATRTPVATTLERYAAVRRRRYRALQHFWRFGRGWLSRVDKALAQALRLVAPAAPAAGPAPANSRPTQQEVPTMDPTTDAPFAQAPTTDSAGAKWWGSSLTIWGALLTAATTVAPAVLAALGIDVPIDLLRRLGTDLATVAQAVGGLVGTVMTILGRVRATSRLERRPMALRI